MPSSDLPEPPGIGEQMPKDDVRQLALQAPHGLLVGLPRLSLPGQP